MDSNMISGRRLLKSESVLREDWSLYPKDKFCRLLPIRKPLSHIRNQKTHDDGIEHNITTKCVPAIKPFHIVFTTMFTAYLKDF